MADTASFFETRRSRRRPSPRPQSEIINSHAVRRFLDVDKHRLIIPVDEYQRDESEGPAASRIIAGLDIVAFQCLTVIERPNGDLIVADGGTRLSVVLKRTDMPTVPCLVWTGLNDQQEADVFLRINLNRRKLQTGQQHHAEVYSRNEMALQVDDLIEKLANARVHFESLGSMRSVVKQNYAATAVIVSIMAAVAADRKLSANVLKGLVRLEVLLRKEGRTLNTSHTIKKIQANFQTFDAVLNAVVETPSNRDSNRNARILARTLNVRLPASVKV